MLPRLGSAEKLLNLTTISHTCAAQFSEAREPNLTRVPLTDSMQSSSAPTSLMHRVDLDVVLRKLISEEQAVS